MIHALLMRYYNRNLPMFFLIAAKIMTGGKVNVGKVTERGRYNVYSIRDF